MKEREFGADVVRACAAALVLCVHFFLNDGYYNAPLVGGWMAVNTMVRVACMTCVPLFLLLTGYLEVGKNWKVGHLRKLFPVLITYVLCGLACLAFKAVYLQTPLGPREWIGQLLNYSAAPYAWYIEMYIGLFLLAPIFDLAWRGMGKELKRWTILSLLLLASLPCLTGTRWDILPDFWAGFYPPCFYFIGRYLKDYPLKVKGVTLFLGWMATAAAVGMGHVYLAQGGPMSHGPLTWWNSPFVIFESVCLFSLLIRAKGEGWPKPCRWVVARVAKLSLPMYLISYIYDMIAYPVLVQTVPQVERRLWFFPVMVVGSLICSGLMAQPIDWAGKAIMQLIPKRREEPQ